VEGEQLLVRWALVLLLRLSLLHRSRPQVGSAALPQPQVEVGVEAKVPLGRGFEAVLVLALCRRSAGRHMA